jgi:MoxR-like ATPase
MATHPERDYAPDVVQKYVRYGASPRGAQAIVLSSKICALMDGRFNVSFEDVERNVLPSLRHRIILNFEGEAEGIRPDFVINKILEEVDRDGRS